MRGTRVKLINEKMRHMKLMPTQQILQNTGTIVNVGYKKIRKMMKRAWTRHYAY